MTNGSQREAAGAEKPQAPSLDLSLRFRNAKSQTGPGNALLHKPSNAAAPTTASHNDAINFQLSMVNAVTGSSEDTMLFKRYLVDNHMRCFDVFSRSFMTEVTNLFNKQQSALLRGTLSWAESKKMFVEMFEVIRDPLTKFTLDLREEHSRMINEMAVNHYPFHITDYRGGPSQFDSSNPAIGGYAPVPERIANFDKARDKLLAGEGIRDMKDFRSRSPSPEKGGELQALASSTSAKPTQLSLPIASSRNGQAGGKGSNPTGAGAPDAIGIRKLSVVDLISSPSHARSLKKDPLQADKINKDRMEASIEFNMQRQGQAPVWFRSHLKLLDLLKEETNTCELQANEIGTLKEEVQEQRKDHLKQLVFLLGRLRSLGQDLDVFFYRHLKQSAYDMGSFSPGALTDGSPGGGDSTGGAVSRELARLKDLLDHLKRELMNKDELVREQKMEIVSVSGPGSTVEGEKIRETREEGNKV
uniref:Uncharacterized protein n=1 Tax=Chromera velia CCMP2878 TaxID=1169474 RepID=A0A0G4IBI3_9ALVE|eukprot:Cvel_12862.t1-p1 / transcript=Cvel_12862.t1 / gene=Cvel_12862 / organism=Chromera_velia_CCMP2878 / gene_product=hypothetical protein / transcript_product=hypothetical protein / location=Cvel_scaffold858:35820-37998(-) / protein_length=472 / sequence_SO=supercontig / SO=protein_coding / is_pseudo=false